MCVCWGGEWTGGGNEFCFKQLGFEAPIGCLCGNALMAVGMWFEATGRGLAWSCQFQDVSMEVAVNPALPVNSSNILRLGGSHGTGNRLF